MSAESRVASRYAKSIISAKDDAKKLDRLKDDALLITQTLESSRDLSLMLRSPIIKSPTKFSILSEVFSKHIDGSTLSFLELICGKNREAALPYIFTEVLAVYYRIKQIQPATVVTSTKIEAALHEKFAQVVKQVSGAKEAMLANKVDKDIIGGFILKIGDKQIDASIRTQLQKIKLSLVK